MGETFLPKPSAEQSGSGYAPVDYLGTGTADSTKFLRGDRTWAVPTAAASLTVKDEGTNVTNTPHTALNFTGSGVTVTDGGSGVATVDIPGGGGTPAVSVTDETTFGIATAVGTSTNYARQDHTHGSPTNPVTAHEAAGDPHTGYQRESEKNAASGYAGLDGSSKLTGSQQVYGTAANTACVGNDSRLSDARTPTSHASSHNAGGGDVLAIDAAAGTGSLRTLGSASTQAAAGNHTHAGGLTVKAAASQTDSTSTTPVKVTPLDQTVGAGTFVFQYFIRYRSSATGTGVKFDVNHSGTVTSFVWQMRYASTGGAAATGAATMAASSATGNLMESWARRAKGTAGITPTVSVDAAGSDMLMVIEGLMVVTVSGDLQLYFGSEATGSTQSVMANSALVLTQIA